MRIQLAVEDIELNQWVAWVFNLPACFSSATTQTDAIAYAPQKITEYFSWLLAHRPLNWARVRFNLNTRKQISLVEKITSIQMTFENESLSFCRNAHKEGVFI